MKDPSNRFGRDIWVTLLVELIGTAFGDETNSDSNLKTLQGGGIDAVTDQAGAVSPYCEDGNHSLTGARRNDAIFGGSKGDLPRGHAGAGEIYCGARQNDIRGGSGEDTLESDADNDKLPGDDDADAFQVDGSADTGQDNVFNFEDGIDLIRITGSPPVSDLAVTGNASAVSVT